MVCRTLNSNKTKLRLVELFLWQPFSKLVDQFADDAETSDGSEKDADWKIPTSETDEDTGKKLGLF